MRDLLEKNTVEFYKMYFNNCLACFVFLTLSHWCNNPLVPAYCVTKTVVNHSYKQCTHLTGSNMLMKMKIGEIGSKSMIKQEIYKW